MNYFKQLKRNNDDANEEDKKEDNKEEEDEENKEDKKEDKKEDEKKDDNQKRDRTVPPLITNLKRKRPHMTRERWMEMAQIRRWNVKITNISIENLYKEPYDPFIEFVVGGDFKIVQKKIKKGEVKNMYTGTLGYSKKTEVIINLEAKDSKLMETRIQCEYQGSYFDVQEQFLRIDVWDWEKWNLNEFLGRVEISLIELIQGDVDQEFILMKYGEKKKIKLCKINFTISFQEIWDFILGFSDWSGCGIISDKGDEDPSASLEISLATQGVFRKRIRTKVVEKEQNPQWPTIRGDIHFRGTINELENQQLSITLLDGGLLNCRKVGVKITDLFGILDSGSITTDLMQQNKRSGGHQCSIKGRINIIKSPKYRQTGEIVLLNSEGQYLCVSVMRVDNVVLPNDKGVVNTFIEVSWGGYMKRTKTAFRTYKPIFNDTFYFPINVPTGLFGNNEDERNKAIMKELVLYSNIHFNFWAIDEQLSNDSLGSTAFFINELQNSKIQEKEFFDEKTQSSQVMKVRVWSGKKQLTSPFIESGVISNLFIDVWVLYENEKKLEYEDLPKEISDNLPDDFENLVREWESTAKDMMEAFPEETQRDFLYMVKDEQDKDRFLPMFVSKLGYPNPSKLMKKSDENVPVDYLTVETLAESCYYCSLIPFSGSANPIWSSPEFLVHMKKGENEDHSIILACLFMSVIKEIRDETERNSDDEINEENSEVTKESLQTQTNKSKGKGKKSEEVSKTEESDMNNRVFVCVGSLKQRKTQHVWVMTIHEDYSGVTFWEVTNNTSFVMQNRVSNSENLKKFLNKEEVEGTALKMHKNSDEDETKRDPANEEDYEAWDDDMSEGSMDDAEDPEKNVEKFKKHGDERLKKEDLPADLRFKYKTKNMNPRDDVGKKSGGTFLENKRAGEQKDPKNYASLVQEPRLLPGANEIEVPYRTIDIIFNNKNIYMNLQHFDPSRIIYDLYDNTLWNPFVPKSTKIFSAFYPPPILLPPLHLPQAKKLQSNILKEIKIGISALRSGKNLPTSWKNQKDPCVELMEQHLLFLERAARGEISDDIIATKKRTWALKMRQFMPTYYRLSALPAHFNFPEPDRISQMFIEKAKEFFCMQHKNMKWAVAVRLFPYVSKITSIRILVTAFYPVPGGQ